MKIEMSKFGKVLISRPQGHEAFLAARAYVLPQARNRVIELDFSHVFVLTPSWADEFIQGLQKEVGNRNVKIVEGGNASVRLALKAVSLSPDVQPTE